MLLLGPLPQQIENLELVPINHPWSYQPRYINTIQILVTATSPRPFLRAMGLSSPSGDLEWVRLLQQAVKDTALWRCFQGSAHVLN